MKTVCLNMIVKNEAHVIRRCLESVLPLVDTWVILDTGSTDGTQDIIRETPRRPPRNAVREPVERLRPEPHRGDRTGAGERALSPVRSTRLPWRYVGVLHEYLECDGRFDRAPLEGVRMVIMGGGGGCRAVSARSTCGTPRS
ncbi:glycosyltransferase [Streptomyces sp. NPDC087859]|uniref:glycosyltransferase n=1 Tax=Streptomyces sp. NPDC087859 TaxID=3365812 RepID=UPI003811AECB